MRCKVTVVGEAQSLRRQLGAGQHAEVASEEELPGSHVVVLGGGVDVAGQARRVASRAPGAVIVVVDGDVRAALEASLFPRGRVVGAGADDALAVAEAVLYDRRTEVTVDLVGLDDAVVTSAAVLGRQGVRELR